MKVYFVGAGPGNPELITVKGKRLIEQAGTVIYAGSLVNPRLLDLARPSAAIYNSASMELGEIIRVMEGAIARGDVVVRLHTGDPGLFGAIQEQINLLEEKKIAWEIVPGVSSMAAAAAALGRELTQPGISQSVIITRLEGRTPVPEKEELSLLSRHQGTMCIFLSVHNMEEVAARLRKEYPSHTPIAVVYKASWPQEKVIQGTLEDISEKVKGAGVEKTAMILVGDFLTGRGEASRLYDSTFSHGCRVARP